MGRTELIFLVDRLTACRCSLQPTVDALLHSPRLTQTRQISTSTKQTYNKKLASNLITPDGLRELRRAELHADEEPFPKPVASPDLRPEQSHLRSHIKLVEDHQLAPGHPESSRDRLRGRHVRTFPTELQGLFVC